MLLWDLCNSASSCRYDSLLLHLVLTEQCRGDVCRCCFFTFCILADRYCHSNLITFLQLRTFSELYRNRELSQYSRSSFCLHIDIFLFFRRGIASNLYRRCLFSIRSLSTSADRSFSPCVREDFPSGAALAAICLLFCASVPSVIAHASENVFKRNVKRHLWRIVSSDWMLKPRQFYRFISALDWIFQSFSLTLSTIQNTYTRSTWISRRIFLNWRI